MAEPTWTISGTKARLKCTAVLTPEDFRAIAAHADISPFSARKVGFVAARRAARQEAVETRWNGKETSNTARAGDWIVTNLSPKQKVLRDAEGAVNTYVISASRFNDLYEPVATEPLEKLGKVYRAKGTVSALLFAGGFDIMAPWGERQTAPRGYLILNGTDVYGNNADTFAATYEQLKA